MLLTLFFPFPPRLCSTGAMQMHDVAGAAFLRCAVFNHVLPCPFCAVLPRGTWTKQAVCLHKPLWASPSWCPAATKRRPWQRGCSQLRWHTDACSPGRSDAAASRSLAEPPAAAAACSGCVPAASCRVPSILDRHAVYLQHSAACRCSAVRRAWGSTCKLTGACRGRLAHASSGCTAACDCRVERWQCSRRQQHGYWYSWLG